MADRIAALAPDLEKEVARGMQLFDVPGVAVGIVTGDKLVYAKGFGTRGKKDTSPVDTRTVFQIGSTTKAFLATTMAILVDRGKLHWGDRVIDLYPGFGLKDPWVTREFRAYDLLAQRSGLPSYVNDGLTGLGYDEDALIRSLRYVQPASSFRSTFAYVNIPHLLTGRIVAKLAGEGDWNAVAQREILAPLGMADTSFTAQAIEAAPDHAMGYLWAPGGTAEIPFDPSFPYRLGPAGNMNSSVEDAARWVRLQLGKGVFEGKRIVSEASLVFTKTPKVAMSDTVSYAMGWVVVQTPNGGIVWHNGGTSGFGAHIGTLPDRDVGVIILSNEGNVGLPDALAFWLYDRLLGNAPKDNVAEALTHARSANEAERGKFRRPANARPSPDLAGYAGEMSNATLGSAVLRLDNGAPVLELPTGAKLAVEPFDGDVFILRLLPQGRFAPIVQAAGDLPVGFAQFQMDASGKLGSLRWDTEGNSFTFTRK